MSTLTCEQSFRVKTIFCSVFCFCGFFCVVFFLNVNCFKGLLLWLCLMLILYSNSKLVLLLQALEVYFVGTALLHSPPTSNDWTNEFACLRRALPNTFYGSLLSY